MTLKKSILSLWGFAVPEASLGHLGCRNGIFKVYFQKDKFSGMYFL